MYLKNFIIKLIIAEVIIDQSPNYPLHKTTVLHSHHIFVYICAVLLTHASEPFAKNSVFFSWPMIAENMPRNIAQLISKNVLRVYLAAHTVAHRKRDGKK